MQKVPTGGASAKRTMRWPMGLGIEVAKAVSDRDLNTTTLAYQKIAKKKNHLLEAPH